MKLGIIGSGMIVYDLLTFIDIIDEIELTAILGTTASATVSRAIRSVVGSMGDGEDRKSVV